MGKFRDRAGTAAEAIGRELTPALFAGAEAIQIEAQLSITNGAVSGKGHVPSRPGEPPNQDTGVLGNNIEASLVDAKHAIIADLLRIAIQQAVIKPLAEGLGAGGIVAGIGKIFGFASGGYTGDMPTNRVAGVVHGGEFVMNAAATRRIGVGNLKALAQGIEPVAATRAASPRGDTIVKNYNISVSADNSVTPAGFARGLAGQILAEAKRMDAQASSATLRAVPGVLSKHDRYGA